MIANKANLFHVAWANNACNDSCTAGNGIAIQFAFDGCTDANGCFTLSYASVLDCSNVVDRALIPRPYATVCGGSVCATDDAGAELAPDAAEPATWGSIKALYNRK